MANQNFDFDPSLAALKQQWRRRLKNIRQGLSSSRREQASTQACLQLRRSCQSAHFVLSFASFGSEINLWPFNRELASEGRLVLPRLIDQQLHLFHVTHLDQLEPHVLGMLEPKMAECSPVDCFPIDIALIPGLGFDSQTKHRLGYGQGHYDQLLATTSFTQSWGIGFAEQAVENLPYTAHDIPLNRLYLF